MAVYTNDHRPPHVHVMGSGKECVFILNCPDGPPKLRGNVGFSTPELNRIAGSLRADLKALCSAWERIHGHH